MFFKKKLISLNEIERLLQMSKSEREEFLKKKKFKFLSGDSVKNAIQWIGQKNPKRSISFPQSKEDIERYNRDFGGNVLWIANYVIFVPDDENEERQINSELITMKKIDIQEASKYTKNEEILKDLEWLEAKYETNIYSDSDKIIASYAFGKAIKIYQC